MEINTSVEATVDVVITMTHVKAEELSELLHAFMLLDKQLPDGLPDAGKLLLKSIASTCSSLSLLQGNRSYHSTDLEWE